MSYNMCSHKSGRMGGWKAATLIVTAIALAVVLVVFIINMTVGYESADACVRACGEGKVRSATVFKCYCKD